MLILTGKILEITCCYAKSALHSCESVNIRHRGLAESALALLPTTVLILMEICKAPTLWLNALNKHTHIMYIEMKNVIPPQKKEEEEVEEDINKAF